MQNMKNTLLSGAILAAFSSLSVAADYPSNPIERPLTLNDGTIEVIGAISHLEQHDGDNETDGGLNLRYGLTDDWQIGFDGVTYSALKGNGLELAVNVGFRGHFDNKGAGVDESVGYGASVFGKQIINRNFALTFGVNYTYWDEDHIENKKEFDYTIGAMMNVTKDVTVFGNYTFRDLKDFEQSSANAANIGVNYNYSKDIDLGLAFSYSDFEEEIGGRAFHETAENAATAYIAYRF